MNLLSKLITLVIAPFLGLIVSVFMITANAFAYETCDEEDEECKNITGYNANLKKESDNIRDQVKSMTDCAMQTNCETLKK